MIGLGRVFRSGDKFELQALLHSELGRRFSSGQAQEEALNENPDKIQTSFLDGIVALSSGFHWSYLI